MPQLKITSVEENHAHIVFLFDRPLEGTNIIGYTSKENGHAHDVILQDVTQQDPNTGQVIVVGQEIILMPNPGKQKTHQHKIKGNLTADASEMEWSPNDSKSQINHINKSENEDSKIDPEKKRYQEYEDIYLSALSHENQYIEDAKTCEKVVFGGKESWNALAAGVTEQRQKTNRPSLSFNMIESVLNTLSGYITQNSSIPRFVPKENGDAMLADILSELMYHYYNKSKGEHIRSEVNLDQIITGRGNYEVETKFKNYDEDDYDLDIKIKYLPHYKVAFTPYDQPDLSDCRGVAKFNWITEGQLMAMLPKDKVKEFEEDGGVLSNFSQGSLSNYPNLDVSENRMGYIDFFYNRTEKKVCVIDVQKKQTHKRTVLCHVTTKYKLDGSEGKINTGRLSKDTIARILTIPGFTQKKSMTQEIWCGKIAAGLLLEDYYSPYQSGFSIAPAIAKKRRIGDEIRIKGKVHDLQDIQTQYNFVESEIANGIRQGIGKTVLYEAEAFSDQHEIDQFSDNLRKGNGVVRVKDIEKIKEMGGSDIPSFAFTLSQTYQNAMYSISGISPELTGQNSKANSSLLYMERVKAALVGNDYIVRNLALAEEMLAIRMLDAFKALTKIPGSKEKVYRILMNNDLNKGAVGGVNIGGKPMMPKDGQAGFTIQDLSILWNADADFAQYDVAIAFGEGSPTKKLADQKMWSELAMQGVGVPPQFILELMDMPVKQKERMNQILQEQMQAQNAIKEKELSMIPQQQQIAAQAGLLKAKDKNQTDILINREKLLSAENTKIAKMEEERNKPKESKKETKKGSDK